uniref:RRM domain-containing protein n=1 Tax=Haemonchus placei TaxID=6290 RepID=A0A0N4WBK1_HAEPC
LVSVLFFLTWVSYYNQGLLSVGNIPYQTTEDAIGNHFSQAGHVTNVRIVYDRETGRPKGFGFCEFADQAGAQNAVNTLNGTDFNGRSLRVNYANKN